MRMLIQSEQIQKIIYAMQKGKLMKYIERLRNKLSKQREVYERLKLNDSATVCYHEKIDKEWGVGDANYTNRLRLTYYLLYEKIDDEAAFAYLFQEDLKDRENNDFQGIGTTIQILTYLLQKHNGNHQYDTLFERAQNANFDCACGYNRNITMDEDIESNDLLDCIYMCEDLEYKDIMELLVEEWKQTVTAWTENNRSMLIQFYTFLGKEADNETLLWEQLASKRTAQKSTGQLSAYRDIIQYYIKTEQYSRAETVLKEAVQVEGIEEIKRIRLFDDFLEAACTLVSNGAEDAEGIWNWAKTELKTREDMYGNLYKKAIDAAKTMGDLYAVQLEKAYFEWREKVGLS